MKNIYFKINMGNTNCVCVLEENQHLLPVPYSNNPLTYKKCLLDSRVRDIKLFFGKSNNILEAPEDPLLAFDIADENLIRDFNRVFGAPIGYCVVSYLTMISTIIGKRTKISIDRISSINLALNVCLIGSSGTAKTQTQTFFFSLLENLSYKNRKLTNIVGQSTRSYIEDAMASDNTGVLLMPDELDGLLNRMKKPEDRSFLIQAYNGNSMSFGKQKKRYMLENPYLSIFGGIQPEPFKQAFTARDRASGFAQRMIFVRGKLTKPKRMDIKNPTIKDDTIKRRELVVNTLLSLAEHHIVQKSYDLTEEAAKLYNSWRNEVFTLQYILEGSNISGMYSKFDVMPCKIALLLHLADMPEGFRREEDCFDTCITQSDMYRAIYLTNWLLKEQQEVWREYLSTKDEPVDLTRVISMAICRNEEKIRQRENLITTEMLTELANKYLPRETSPIVIGRTASKLGFMQVRGGLNSPNSRSWRIDDNGFQYCKQCLGMSV